MFFESVTILIPQNWLNSSSLIFSKNKMLGLLESVLVIKIKLRSDPLFYKISDKIRFTALLLYSIVMYVMNDSNNFLITFLKTYRLIRFKIHSHSSKNYFQHWDETRY